MFSKSKLCTSRSFKSSTVRDRPCRMEEPLYWFGLDFDGLSGFRFWFSQSEAATKGWRHSRDKSRVIWLASSIPPCWWNIGCANTLGDSNSLIQNDMLAPRDLLWGARIMKSASCKSSGKPEAKWRISVMSLWRWKRKMRKMRGRPLRKTSLEAFSLRARFRALSVKISLILHQLQWLHTHASEVDDFGIRWELWISWVCRELSFRNRDHSGFRGLPKDSFAKRLHDRGHWVHSEAAATRKMTSRKGSVGNLRGAEA